MTRSDLIAEISRRHTSPEAWGVEAIDEKGDGDIDVTLFSGPNAKGRAIEYAAAKYVDHRVLADSR